MKTKSSLPRLLSSLVFAAVAVFSVSCASKGGGGAANTSDKFDPVAYRPKYPGAVQVKLSTGAQRIYVVENGRVLLASPCSVGTASDPTPKGNFRIYHKNATRRRQSEPDRGYPMAYWMEFKPAYGIHWGFVKPYPCTHGCVRLPMKTAAKMFSMVPTGAPLNVSTSQPEDATHGRSLPVLDDGPLPNPPKSYLHSPQFFQDAQYKGRMFAD
jgi:hypothetical protein